MANSFRKNARKLFLDWAESKSLSVKKSKEPFGKVLTFENKLSICLDPRGESSQALRDAQVAAKTNGKVLYFLYPWDGDLTKLLSHFESKLGLDSRKFAARKLDLRQIDNKLADGFMKEYHIQGSARGSGKISLGLFHKQTSELLAVQQFARYRFFGTKGKGAILTSPVWEGLRLAFLPGVQIYGATTRLQKHFEQEWKPEKIISYVSSSHSTGDYKLLQGFSRLLSKTNEESYYWVLEGEPKDIKIIDKEGNERHPDLDKCLATPWLNPTTMAGAFGKGVGVTFYGGRLGSRKQLREHAENGELVHNDIILEAIGYVKRWTPGQYKWEKNFPENVSAVTEETAEESTVETDSSAADSVAEIEVKQAKD